MNFSKKQFVDKKREETVQRIVYSILFLTMIPSVFITYNMVRQSYFETTAYQFVNTQLDFPETQVLNKRAYIHNGKKIIEVTLIGREVPKDSVLAAESRLASFGLKDTQLKISQGYQNQAIDINSLNSLMFQDIYKDSQEKIEKQEREIGLLNDKITRYQQYDSLGIIVAPEIKVLFPKIQDIAISKTVFSQIDRLQLDTVMLAVVKYSHPMTENESLRFREWLQARMDVKNIRVVVEKETK